MLAYKEQVRFGVELGGSQLRHDGQDRSESKGGTTCPWPALVEVKVCQGGVQWPWAEACKGRVEDEAPRKPRGEPASVTAHGSPVGACSSLHPPCAPPKHPSCSTGCHFVIKRMSMNASKSQCIVKCSTSRCSCPRLRGHTWARDVPARRKRTSCIQLLVTFDHAPIRPPNTHAIASTGDSKPSLT